jgi:acetyl-CoA carboxylase carboxyltransferase component
MLALAAEWRLPVVLFAEGGGGRPGDVDMPIVAGLDTPSFLAFAALSPQASLSPTAALRGGPATSFGK